MRTRASARRLLVVAAIAVVMTPWIVVVLVLANPTPPAADRLDRPTAIAWGGRVFSDQPSLTAWLRARGASYGAWAALHPYDAAIVEGTAIPAAGSRRSAAGSGAAASTTGSARPGTRAVGTIAGPVVPGQTSQSRSVSWVKLLVLAIASVTMLLALLPAPVLASGREIELSATTRTYVFAVCAAVCVGVLIAGVRA